MGNFRKKYTLILWSIFVNLFFLELFSFLALLFLGTAHWNYEGALEKISKTVLLKHSIPEQQTYIYKDLFKGNVPHPYFAFKYKGSSYGDKKWSVFDVDVHGFYGDVKFPFEKK